MRQGVPERGDIVWINFSPQAGHEQRGRRPAMILSPAIYNGKTGLALCCPITNQIKGYPFEVPLPDGLEVTGVILADQAKNLDWKVRDAVLIGALPDVTVNEVLLKLSALLAPVR